MPPLHDALKKLGLGDKERAVMLVLLQNGPLLVASVARIAKLNRTTTYGILKELAEKGLASSSTQGKVIRYQSIEPDLLPGYIERHAKELEESKTRVQELVPQIKLLRSKGKVLPKIQFFEGKEGVEQAYEDTIENNKGKKIWAFTGSYKNLGQKFVDYYVNKRTKLGVEAKYLIPKTEWGIEAKREDEKWLRHAKFIPPEYTFDTEIVMYDNKVTILSYALENPVALIIEDETISKAMKTIFDFAETKATEE